MSKTTDIDLGPLPELIGYVLRRAQLVVFQDFFGAFAPFDIRPAQFSVLTVIERNPGLTQSQVARRSGSSGPISSACSTSWSGAGSPSGGRRRATSAPMRSTSRPKGAALMRKLKPVLKAHESRMVALVGEEGRDRLVALLHEIADGRGDARNGAALKGAKASRSPRPGSAET